MTRSQRYAQTRKPLPAAARSPLAGLLLHEIAPQAVVDASNTWTAEERHGAVRRVGAREMFPVSCPSRGAPAGVAPTPGRADHVPLPAAEGRSTMTRRLWRWTTATYLGGALVGLLLVGSGGCASLPETRQLHPGMTQSRSSPCWDRRPRPRTSKACWPGNTDAARGLVLCVCARCPGRLVRGRRGVAHECERPQMGLSASQVSAEHVSLPQQRQERGHSSPVGGTMPSNGASRSAEGLAGTPDRPKRFCCHAMTVRGCTNTRIACQPVHSRER